jgi:hypothetical protein
VSHIGSGRHWRPLGEALLLLWDVDPWREELRQLLLLLAIRAVHRLPPLPWAMLLTLRVHGRSSRAKILAAFALFDERCAPRSIQG